MIQTGFEPRVKVQEIISNQLPSFILDENPKAVDFFKQYYISQEYQGGTSDLSENLDQYLKVDNLIPEVVVDSTTTVGIVTSGDSTINVSSTKGYPDTYGLLKIDSEVITYTGKTSTSFTGCVRGFSGITSYHQDTNQEELVFSDTVAADHVASSSVQNLSTLFLKEFYKKLKATFTPGLEDVDFHPSVNAGNFIKEARSLYESKGTDDSFKILCKVLYGVDPSIINLEDYLIKPSAAQYIRRFVTIAEAISGDPNKLVGQSITKLTDAGTNASISEVEPFTRNNQQYFKVSLFIGYDDLSTIEGTFQITPSTKATQTVAVGSSVVTVDSTIGFAQTGYVLSGINSITYTDKSINQFLGCTGIGETIEAADNVRSDEIYFGYEDGDETKKVELRLTGVLSKFEQISDNINVVNNDIISVKNLGSNVKNPETDKTYKQIFFNSWIYNTSSRYNISDVSNYTLASKIDRSSLKKGDRVEILQRDSNVVDSSPTNIAYIASIINSENRVTLDNLSFTAATGQDYDIRRKLNTASASNVTMLYGNNTTLSDVLNTYDERGKYAYVASNSLPSNNNTTATSIEYAYEISKEVNTTSISAGTVGIITDGFADGTFRTIKFSNPVPFIEGDKIFYKPDVAPLVGLETGAYFVSIVSPDKKQINLYSSRSFVGGPNYLKFRPQADGHRFTLFSQRSNVLGPQKLLKKFTLEPNIKNGVGELTIPGSTGMLINGVEISNYKSDDKIYFGPLESVNLLNGGKGYDVINLPVITATTGTGTTAKIRPVISGSFEKVYVDPQDFDIQSIVSIGITGGNGTGAVLEAQLTDRFRNIFFDARYSSAGGGINSTTDQLIFKEDHNLTSGEEIIYHDEGNTPIGIGTTTLVDRASYFAKIDNNRTIQLFESKSDFLAGINTVDLTSSGNGTQKFTPAKSKKTIASIVVVDGGSGYTNRNLFVKPAGINTTNHTINFVDHGFEDGDRIVYENTDGTSFESPDITVGVKTASYMILKVDDDTFRLADIGIGGTNLSKYEQRENIRIEGVGSGLHQFKFPDISVDVQYTSVGFGTTTQSYQTVNAVPVVRGSIIDSYLYEAGTGYGSTILNHHRKPLITITSGKNAQLEPIVVNGRLEVVNIDSGGNEYTSLPDIELVDPTGAGTGADIRPIISGGKLTDVKIVNPGIGYSSTSTLRVKSTGINALFDADVRGLTVTNTSRFGNELLNETDEKLQYSVLGYFDTVRDAFNEDSTVVSKIIGWAYDGNPIYGPFGYSDVDDTNSTPKRIESGYELKVSDVVDRPSGFDNGFFVEDYSYTNSGDLDEYNGRFAKTSEFPNGVYAYYATIDSSNDPQFPFFIGNKYRSNTLSDNETLNQEFDFNSSNLLRNTFPYKVSDSKADNDFIIETNEVINQKSIVESQTKGSITGFDIVNPGSNYMVNDVLNFEPTSTGGGLISRVSKVGGKNVTDITSTIEEFPNAVFTLDNDRNVKVTIKPSHTILDGESVIISGFSTNLSRLNDSFEVGVTSFRTSLIQELPAGTSGVSTEIYVGNMPEDIAINSQIGISTEVLTVLEIFKNKNIIKVERSLTGISHTATSEVSFKPDSFTIKSNLEFFDSKVNQRVYFNPTESVGVGTIIGVSTSVTFTLGNSLVTRDIPSRTITLENHPFENNQNVTFTADGTAVSISTSPTGTPFNLPSNVFVVDKNINSIGIKTTLTSSEVYFRTVGANSDEYRFDTNFVEITGKVQKVRSQVSVSTSHELKANDVISLDVAPSLSVGIGTSTAVRVKRNTLTGNIQINPITFAAAGVNTVTNQINLPSHGLKTLDKVDYDANTVASGLHTNTYYVYRVDDDNIQLSTTQTNVQQDPPVVVDILSTGGSIQTISPINPQVVSIKENNLVFDLEDSSLEDYQFKIYYDNAFNNEVVSISTTGSFTIVGLGTVGVTTGATLTVNHNSELPRRLYYNIEKSGFISTADKEVKQYSEILFENSAYSGDYHVSPVGLAGTTFNIFLNEVPEKLSYIPTECAALEYDTSSVTASGPIKKINIVSGGSNYEQYPVFTDVTGSDGKDAYIVPTSSTIGNAETVRVINEGFEYSSDKTLQPTADISPLITIRDSNTVGLVSVTDGGKFFIDAPAVTVVNPSTREKINSGVLLAEITDNSITRVTIEQEPKGLPETTALLFTENNTNGISVQKVFSNENSGIITCHITTPTVGFPIAPFATGDEVFVEGIQKYSSTGTGFNSPDLGYRFYTVTNYDTTSGVLDRVTLDGTSFITNAGLAKTEQDATGIVINKNNYPVLEAIQKRSAFFVGEKVLINGAESNLTIASYDELSIKVNGTDELKVEDVLTGVDSGNVATISSLDIGEGIFTVDYSIKKDIGWETNVGMLDFDDQVTPDNDYYQNLSYSIKSPLTYEKTTEVVKGLLHTAGMRDFADTGITSATSAGISDTDDQTGIFKDLLTETRVDTVYEFDLVRDIDVVDNTSKFITFKNKKLTDYIDCRSNRVLKIDNINSQFSNLDGEPSKFLNIFKLDPADTYTSILFRVSDKDMNEVQLSDLVILSSGGDSFLLDKGSVVNTGSSILHADGDEFGTFEIITDSLGDSFLRFTPDDPDNIDYDLKSRTSKFNSTAVGVNTQAIGFINLVSSNGITTQTGFTTALYTAATDEFEGLFADVQVINKNNNQMNFAGVYLTHDGTDTFISDYYNDSDSTTNFLSINEIGSFGANIISGIATFTYTSDTEDDIDIRARIVGFGTTSIGIGTHRYKNNFQTDGSERSIIYQSNFVDNVSTATTVVSVSNALFDSMKSYVRVSVGDTSALHQVLMIKDNQQNVYIQQSPFLSVGSTTGIGTFGGDIDGTQMILTFTPDTASNVSVSAFSEIFYTKIDSLNTPNVLNIGAVSESVGYNFYNAINGDRINRTQFTVNHNSVPIFAKVFNPEDTTVLDLTASGASTFKIDDHFFQNNEELIYTPQATFVGVGSTAMQYIPATPGSVDVLPERVFAIVGGDDDSFQISTSRAGAAITISSLGEGNAHMFEMAKRNSKSLISVNNIAQYPIALTNISHTLDDNGGSIGIADTIFSLSGISTIKPKDLIKIDNEFMIIENVGLGTTAAGPITNTGAFSLVQVERGAVGSSRSTHQDTTGVATVFKGGYNLVGQDIFFTEAPRGNPQFESTSSNLDFPVAAFNGRVYLRQDYDTNQVYDDISDEFTGIGRTFTLSVDGGDTTGIGTTGGNGVLFINGIFQTPTTENNPANNFSIVEDLTAGISSVSFSGIRDQSNNIFTSEFDVNMGELPRGGMIVSLGSTGGLGYAPLVGAAVTAVVSGGVITSVGLGTTDNVGSGYNGLVAVGVSIFESGHTGDTAVISAAVGAGGTLTFTVSDGGTGYTAPSIFVSEPNYDNLAVEGISRLSIGATTDTGIGLLLDITVGSSSTVGVGSTYHEITSFGIARPGYSFQKGDRFKPVGLVTARGLAAPLSEYELEVLEVFTDNFGSWQFGEIDYIDSIKNFQDGVRKRFPLFYNNELLSFEAATDSDIDLASALLIIIDGVIQEPNVAYTFEGGTNFALAEPPLEEANIDIFFYRGTRGTDTVLITSVDQIIEKGDEVQIMKNNAIRTTESQEKRTVFNLDSSDKLETNRYFDQGINDTDFKPINIIKQKVDQVINGENVFKTRDSIETQIFPVAKIIKDFNAGDTEIFLDNADLFKYDAPNSFSMMVVAGIGSTEATGNVEFVGSANTYMGFSGIVTGITTTTGIGVPLALEMEIISNDFTGLNVGYPIYISDTNIGTGVTSINDSDAAVVGIGSTFLDNVYYIHGLQTSGTVGIITCNIHSASNVVGLGTTMNIHNPVGKYSWGRVADFTRSGNPISIGVSGFTIPSASVGISTFPIAQRRGVGLRDNGSLPKQL